MRLYLASTSPARLSVLRGAGIEPICFSPEVDEDAAIAAREAELGRALTAPEFTEYLGRLKAEDVVRRHGHEIDGLVLGGDSMFLLNTEILGKPHLPEVALARAQQHRGRTGVLHSGHWVIDHTGGRVRGAVGGVDTARVSLAADVTDAELAAYVATGEPLELAGGFAIDGLAGAFIERIEGAPSCVIGLSLPELRRLVVRLGHEYPALWNLKSPV
ncbi:septum formation protein [Leucobacter luti]|uniref:Nucleoside triphosphate pyrophosphatase n=1 Tax=Leucobacter luti TaxID=340320 RepID=A0A4R6RX87_9MICO|nr:nucleoside triphosphate pyrophosphatase [Leucobacter luti]MCW2289781.1 septum formation protein [Leucobacter luti]TCK34317.1 septum formation protein [Leucobacter luti]TDP90945.1 septum formation protein [Leucobacter luti]